MYPIGVLPYQESVLIKLLSFKPVIIITSHRLKFLLGNRALAYDDKLKCGEGLETHAPLRIGKNQTRKRRFTRAINCPIVDSDAMARGIAVQPRPISESNCYYCVVLKQWPIRNQRHVHPS